MRREVRGMTLLDMMVAITIVSIVSAIAVPVYTSFVEDAKESQAVADILEIEMAIDRFNFSNFAYPDDLTEVPGIPSEDPWGTPYQYFRIEGSSAKGVKGKQRKDKNLNPLNTDYDLYSKGKDQNSKLPLTAKASHDDILRAGNGGYVGRGDGH